MFLVGSRFANRLTGIKENSKFQKNEKTNNINNTSDTHEKEEEDQASGLKLVVEEAKQHHHVKYEGHTRTQTPPPLFLTNPSVVDPTVTALSSSFAV